MVLDGVRRSLRLIAALVPGLIGARAAEPRVIALPPFLVEETAQHPSWHYAELGGREVLSSCPDRFTRTLVVTHLRLQAELGELVTPALQWQPARETLLFVDGAQPPAGSQEIVAALRLTAAEQDRLADVTVPVDDGRLRRRPPPPRYTFVPNLRLWDRDGGALFAMVREKEFDARHLALTAEYVSYVLRNRVPALPPWFISGALSLFARARFTADALVIEPIDWPSGSGSAALREGPAANRALLPLARFFAGDLAETDTTPGDALSVWQAQAALLARWGIAGRGAPRREAWWRFVARAATEPVTESLFHECFGIDFAAAERQLAAFLPEAMRDRLELQPAPPPRAPDLALRPASDVEIARLKGDWERLEIGYVRAQFPVLTAKYAEQARRTLRRAYDAGSRDPRLLAAMGLCEVDAGNDSAARPLLEEAFTRDEALRPRAGFELSRLRFATWRGRQTADAPAVLSSSDAAEVLAPLLGRGGLPPQLAEAYELIAEVWAACAELPTRVQMSQLEAGVRLFPRRAELVARTAELNLRRGDWENARWLITLGLTLAPDPVTRARLEALRAKLQVDR